jgi:hypothetical protein
MGVDTFDERTASYREVMEPSARPVLCYQIAQHCVLSLHRRLIRAFDAGIIYSQKA